MNYIKKEIAVFLVLFLIIALSSFCISSKRAAPEDCMTDDLTSDNSGKCTYVVGVGGYGSACTTKAECDCIGSLPYTKALWVKYGCKR